MRIWRGKQITPFGSWTTRIKKEEEETHLVIDHVQAENTDGVLDLLASASPISDVVARRHWKYEFRSFISFQEHVMCCSTALAYARNRWLGGVALHAVHFRGSWSWQKQCLQPLSWNNIPLVLRPGLNFFCPISSEMGGGLSLAFEEGTKGNLYFYTPQGGHLWVEKKPSNALDQVSTNRMRRCERVKI